MEGSGDSSDVRERRAPRIRLDIDLNKVPEPEPEEEQVPHTDAPKVANPNPQPAASPRIRAINKSKEKDPDVDMLLDSSKMEQDELVNPNKLARATNKSPAKESRAGERQELKGPVWKRVRINPGDAAASSAERSIPPKLKWKTQGMGGGADAQNP